LVIVREAIGRLELQAPYHPLLPIRSKQIGRKWMGPQISWVFPLEEEPALRALCLDIWAVDGSPDSLQDLVTLHIVVDEQTPHSAGVRGLRGARIPCRARDAASLQNRRAARPGRGFSS
jgi:hypothetical protein